ncbi:MAG: tetratricopeptide repeat protein [Balneolaceae bacterium]|nr:tetratricopeptide repeat protein [Balneolaceae bacterium]MBO6547362.1 tetratricopeptide repeat protein [Balneolaceae bacterium]MBO6647691.1 tetratricopeptide repeat protein [Balneolaceae bacterium]
MNCLETSVVSNEFVVQDQLEFLANKAEDAYPAKLDSTVIYANELIDKIRDEGLISGFEEQMLDLLGRTYRRMRNAERSEEYFLEAIELSEHRGNNAQLGDSYNRIGLLYRGIGRYEEALESYKRSLDFKLQVGNENSAAGTLNNMGALYRAMGQKEEAYDSFIQSIEIRKRIGEEDRAAAAYLNLGNWMADEADYDTALELYDNYYEIVSSQKDTLAMSSVSNNMGNIFNLKGDLDEALKFYIKGDSLFKSSGIKDNLEAILNINIGIILSKTGNLEQAIDFYKRAWVISEEYDDKESIGTVFQNIGQAFENLDEPDSSLHYYERAIEVFEPLGNQEQLAQIYENIGVIYNQESAPEFALNYLLKAVEIFEEAENDRSLANLYNNIGLSYYYLRQYNQAISYFRQSLEKATETQYLEVEERVTSGLAEAYNEIGDFENAFKYQQLNDVYEDSLLNLERVKVIEELITKYETEKVEAENNLLLAEQAQNEAIIERRNAENRALLTGILALVAAVLGIIAWMSYSNRKKRIIAEQKESLYQTKIDSLLDRQQLESVSAMLEGQEKERKRLAAELHDRLGSILSLVKMYFSSLDDDIKEKQPELHASFTEGNQFLDDAFKEVRALIKEMQEGAASGEGLEKDLNELLDKIAKLGIEIKSRIELDKKLDTIVEMNVYRVIQEALSNSLKYSKAELIELVLSDTDQLTVMIKDNGVGFDPEKVPHKEDGDASYGVGNMENRVKLLGGEFELKTKEGQGVTIDIHIPLVDNEGIWGTPDLN